MTRICARPGCRQPAAATLSYAYADRLVWIDPLGAAHPMTHDLCADHTEGVNPPRGWTVRDRRPTLVDGFDADRIPA